MVREKIRGELRPWALKVKQSGGVPPIAILGEPYPQGKEPVSAIGVALLDPLVVRPFVVAPAEDGVLNKLLFEGGQV